MTFPDAYAAITRDLQALATTAPSGALRDGLNALVLEYARVTDELIDREQADQRERPEHIETIIRRVTRNAFARRPISAMVYGVDR